MTLISHRTKKRRGFTLMELLMVVAIISILATISVAVMSGITTQAEQEATKVTIRKVNRLLEARIEAFERAFKRGRRDEYVEATVELLKVIDGRFDYYLTHPSEAPPAIELLAYKAGFRFEIPQRIEELNINGGATPTSLPGGAEVGLSASVTNSSIGLPYVMYLKLAFPVANRQLMEEEIAAPSTAEINTRVSENWDKHIAWETSAEVSDIDEIYSTESSELLYFMLTQSGTYGAALPSADQFLPSEIGDVDEDGLPEFVDAWGQPLQFYRWPTRLVDPTAPSPFQPDFDTLNDNTEVDPTPYDDDGDDSTIEDTDTLREIMPWEREYAGLLIKGLPPTPIAVGSSTQRDLMLVDPDDPVGILYTFLEDPQFASVGVDLTQEYNEEKYHTPDTYHAPLIVSAGPDGQLGLKSPGNTNAAAGVYGNLAQYAGTSATDDGDDTTERPASVVVEKLLDNVTNRNRRSGGRR